MTQMPLLGEVILAKAFPRCVARDLHLSVHVHVHMRIPLSIRTTCCPALPQCQQAVPLEYSKEVLEGWF